MSATPVPTGGHVRAWRHWEDYRRFHLHALSTRDVDPVYPVLLHLLRSLGADTETRLWAVLLHVAYYDLGSSLRVLAEVPRPGPVPPALLGLPCATERRGHRNRPALDAHLRSIGQQIQKYGSLTDWLSPVYDLSDGRGNIDEQLAWGAASDLIGRLFGNGRWAAYKTCEMLAAVAGMPLRAPDMGHAHSTGPRKGLALLSPAPIPLGNSPEEISQLDRLSRFLVEDLRDDGAAASIETAETTLCDFHALSVGRYYVGHDIDKMQHQLSTAPSGLSGAAFAARQAALPAEYLGECTDRSGVDRERRRAYRDTGEILTRSAGRR